MAKAVPVDPDNLISAARHLVEHNPQGRPNNAFLRRAVSTAYYALFHEVLREAAANLMPNGHQKDQLKFARSFAHAQINLACGWIAQRGDTPPPKLEPLVIALRKSQLVPVADAYYDLKIAREAADYDHLHDRITKVAVNGYIDDAEKAIAQLRAAPLSERHAFFALLAICAQGKSS